MAPNGIGAALGITQLALIRAYPAKRTGAFASGGGAPNGLDALPHALPHASLPSPNGSSVGGGDEPVGGGKSRRGRGRFGADGRGARGGKSAKSNQGLGGKGDQPGAGPKTLPKPRIAPQTQ